MKVMTIGIIENKIVNLISSTTSDFYPNILIICLKKKIIIIIFKFLILVFEIFIKN